MMDLNELDKDVLGLIQILNYTPEVKHLHLNGYNRADISHSIVKLQNLGYIELETEETKRHEHMNDRDYWVILKEYAEHNEQE